MRTRLALSVAGVVLAVAAIVRDDRRIAWAAMVVLAIALVSRGAVRWRSSRRSDDEDLPSA